METIQFVVVVGLLVFLFIGEKLISLLPSFRKIKQLSKPLGRCTLTRELNRNNFTLKVLCETPFIAQYYQANSNDLEIEDATMKFADVFAIVSYYQKTIHHILGELKVYAVLSLILITAHFLANLVTGTEAHGLLELLPFFEIIMFIFFTARLVIEYMKVSSLVK